MPVASKGKHMKQSFGCHVRQNDADVFLAQLLHTNQQLMLAVF